MQMKFNKPLLMCVIFTVGAFAGAIGSWALKPSIQSTGNAVPTTPSSIASADPTRSPTSSSQTATNGLPTSAAQSASQAIGSNIGVSEHDASTWLEVNDHSNYRLQLNALNRIASATEAELIDIITDVEQNSQRSYENAWVYRAALQRWSEINSQAVHWHLDELLASSNMNTMDRIFEVIRALAITDYDVMSQWLANLDPQHNKYPFIANQAYSVLAESNPLAALEQALQSNNSGNMQQQSIEQIVMQWSNQDPQAAIEWINQNPDLVKKDYMKEIAISHLMYSNPQAGLDMIPTIENAQRRNQMQAEYAAQLANTSPEQAYAWASELGIATSRSMAQQRVLEVWSYSDPETAISFVSTLSEGEVTENALHNLYSSAAHTKGMTDPASAMIWAESLPTKYANNARQTVFYSWVEQSPEDAMQWAEYSADPHVSEMLMQSMAPMISNTNLELALRLYPNMNSDTQSQMAYGIVQQLYNEDPSNAEHWVNALPQGPAKTEANTMLVMSLADSQPERALDMALQQSGEMRTQLLMQLSYSTASQHPDVLKNWVAGANLTDEERQMMTQVSDQLHSDDPVLFRGMDPYGQFDHYQEMIGH